MTEDKGNIHEYFGICLFQDDETSRELWYWFKTEKEAWEYMDEMVKDMPPSKDEDGITKEIDLFDKLSDYGNFEVRWFGYLVDMMEDEDSVPSAVRAGFWEDNYEVDDDSDDEAPFIPDDKLEEFADYVLNNL